jgi:hypothetical protein
VVRVPGYTTEMYCGSCEVRTEFIYVMWKKVDRLCGLVVRVPGYRTEMYCEFICYVEESKLAAPVYKAENTAVWIRHAHHVAPSTRKHWHFADKRQPYSSLADSVHGVRFCFLCRVCCTVPSKCLTRQLLRSGIWQRCHSLSRFVLSSALSDCIPCRRIHICNQPF